MELKHTVANTMMHILARPRIHIGLADMGYASLRSFGGVGFSLDCEPTVIEFESCRTVEIDGTGGLDATTHLDLSELVKRLKAVRKNVGFRAIIKSLPRQHVGLGSKTSLLMSIIAGANSVNGLGFSNEEMQQLSGRGAASGVGLHAFFHGGLIWDAGHRSVPGVRLSPSGEKMATSVPVLMARIPFPSQWCVALLLSDEPTLSGEDEAKFFSENVPVLKGEALETMSTLYHGVLPAFMLADYEAIGLALQNLHRVGFKMRELERCSTRTQTCLAALFQSGLAAGVSSVGPLLYVIVPRSDRKRLDQVRSISSDFSVPIVGIASGWNTAHELRPGAWL